MPPKGRARKRKADDETENLLNLSGDANTGATDVATIRTVLEGDGSVKTHLQDLAELASTDHHKCIATLVTLLLECSGVKQPVEPWQIQENASDPAPIIVEVSDRIPRTASERYPLASKDKKWDKFKYNFPLFWKNLVVQLEAKEVLYNEAFTDLLTAWIAGLSQSRVRSFRHQATAAAYSMISACCKLAVDLESLRSQLASAGDDGPNSPKKRRITKKATLRGKDAELEVRNKLQAVSNLITEFCSVTSEMRIRDVLPEIRLMSVEAQGKWSMLHPTIFLKDEYTKRLAFTLSDEDESVRFSALCAFEKLYKKEGNFAALQGLTNKFKRRFIEMTLDISRQNSVKALEVTAVLLDHQRKRKEEIFAPNILEGLLKFVCHEKQSVRRAGGRVFDSILTRRVMDVLKQEQGASQPSAKVLAERKLNEIIQWLCHQIQPLSDDDPGNELAAEGLVESLTWTEATSNTYPSLFSHFEHVASIVSSSDPASIVIPAAAASASQKKKKKKADDTADAENLPDSALILKAAVSLLSAITKFASGKLNLKLPTTNDPAPALTKGQKKKMDTHWHSQDPQSKSKSVYAKMRAFFPEFLAETLEANKTNPAAVRALCSMFGCIDTGVWSEGAEETERLFKDSVIPAVRECFFIATDDETLVSVCWVFKMMLNKGAYQDHVATVWEGVISELLQRHNKTKGIALFWKRLALAIEEVPCKFVGTHAALWELVVQEDLMDPDLPRQPYASDVVSAASSLLYLRTYYVQEAKGEQLDTGIVLEKDYPDMAGSLLQLLKSQDASLSVREAALHALSDTWVMGCLKSLLAHPTNESQEAFMQTFEDLVPDSPEPGKFTPLEFARLQKRSETAISAFCRLWVLRIINKGYLSRVFIKWPLLHSRAQEMIKRLNGSLQQEAPEFELNAIIEANERYLAVEQTKVEEAEHVLRALCRRLAQLNMGKQNKQNNAVMNILTGLEEYASKTTANYFVLYAATPYVRYLSPEDASILVQKIRLKEYDMTDDMAVCISHFITQLQKRCKDPKADIDHDDGDDDDKDKGKRNKAVIKGSRHSHADPSSKRTARGLHFDDDASDDDIKKSPKAKKARKPAAKKPAGKAAGKKRGRAAESEPSVDEPSVESKRSRTTRRLELDEQADTEMEVPKSTTTKVSPQSSSKITSTARKSSSKSETNVSASASAPPSRASTGKKIRLSDNELSFNFNDDDDDDEDEDEDADVGAASPDSSPKTKTSQRSSLKSSQRKSSEDEPLSLHFNDDDGDDEENNDAASNKNESAASQESVMVGAPRRRRRAKATFESPQKSVTESSSANPTLFPSTEENEAFDENDDDEGIVLSPRSSPRSSLKSTDKSRSSQRVNITEVSKPLRQK